MGIGLFVLGLNGWLGESHETDTGRQNFHEICGTVDPKSAWLAREDLVLLDDEKQKNLASQKPVTF